VTAYSWNTTGCYVNNRNERRCFPNGQIVQTVSEDNVYAKDAGTVRCTVVINGGAFTSGPFTLRISGMYVCCTLLMYKLFSGTTY